MNIAHRLSGKISKYMENPHSLESRKIEVGNQLQYLRKEAGLTQKEVCDIVEVTPQSYSGYEKGKYEPSLETICRLAMLYEVTTDHILCNWIDEVEEGASWAKNEMDNQRIADLEAEVQSITDNMNALMKAVKDK